MQRHLAILEGITCGEQAIDEGNVFSQSDAKKAMSEWLALYLADLIQPTQSTNSFSAVSDNDYSPEWLTTTSNTLREFIFQ